uniref:Barrier-to-autointegration factor-like protein n=2 Tax=Diabrotica virgifera virgifera TaxID=50390 RepID=A0A6P7GKV6_DIAVI
MSGPTQVHENFVSEPMGLKPVTKLAGIGETLGKRLVAAGFEKAYAVLGQFLFLKKDEEHFRDWLKSTCLANSKDSSACWECLNEWCSKFLFDTNNTKIPRTSDKPTDKHENFVIEPLGEKLVTELPGIGKVHGKRLVDAGFDKAYVVLGKFLLLKKDRGLFRKWLEETCSVSSKGSLDCWNYLYDYCTNFV